MKIVSWNCRYGLNDVKARAILEFYPDADIFIIQECKRADIASSKINWKFKNWYGDDQDLESALGIAIFSKNYNVEFTDVFNRKFRYVVPYKITVNNKSLFLLAVWTKSDKGGNYYYDKNVTQAVSYYKDLLIGDAMMIGDFNTFAKNDNSHLKNLETNMAPMINCAKDTPFWKTETYYHNEISGYGINDFCFASKSLSEYKKDFKTEHFDQGKNSWNGSDHCPIMVEFDF